MYLEKRKEQKEQLSDLLPEFINRKRKFEVENINTWHNSSSERSSNNTRFNNRFQNTQNNYTKKRNVPKEGNKSSNYRQDGNKKENNGSKSVRNSSWGSFRIPKRNDN